MPNSTRSREKWKSGSAKEGFIAFAPDALDPKDGYPGNDDEGRAMQGAMDRAKIEQDFIAAWPEYEENPELAWQRTVDFFKKQLA